MSTPHDSKLAEAPANVLEREPPQSGNRRRIVRRGTRASREQHRSAG
jgi:hypothetical protein